MLLFLDEGIIKALIGHLSFVLLKFVISFLLPFDRQHFFISKEPLIVEIENHCGIPE